MSETGYKIDGAFLKGHSKISDLIIFDGPVLSHFKNQENEDFIYYWIDQNDTSYSWLIFKIDFLHIKEYLSGNYTLRELILHENIQYYFVADYSDDNKQQFSNVKILNRQNLSTEYLPDKESYYLFEIPKVYESLLSLSELNQTEYIQLLRENAIFIRISETEVLHRHIPSLDNLTSFLAGIKKSYQSYVEESYKRNFINLYASLSDFNKAIDRILENLQLRVVDAKIASFGIGLSTDAFLMSGDIKHEIKEWSSNVIGDYNNEVIELDYFDKDNLNYVLKNYSPESRKNIFKPILDLYSNPSFEVSVSKRNFQSVAKVKRPNKNLVRQLTDVPHDVIPPPKEKEFVTIAVEIEKGADLSEIPKKVFSSQPLFEKRSDSIELTKPELNLDEISIIFKSPLVLNVMVKNGIHVITSAQLNLAIERAELNDALNLLATTIYSYWTRFNDLSMSIETYKTTSGRDLIMLAVAELVDRVISK